MNPLASIPTAPGAVPLLGHLGRLRRDPLRFLTSLPDLGDLVRVRLGPVPAVVVCDPNLTDHVLRHDRLFDKGGLLFDQAKEMVGDGLASCPHHRHRRQRRLIQPAFHHTRFPGYTQATQAGEVTDAWKDGQILDVNAAMTTITSKTLLAAIFADSLPTVVLRQALEDLTVVVGGIFRRMMTPPPLDRLPTRASRRYHRANTRLRGTLSDLITARRAEGADRGDLLSVLLTARDSEGDGRGLSDTELVDQVVTFFAAGAESTANTLAWALHLLSGHPDVEARLHAEVDTVLAGRPATHDDLPRRL